MRMVFRKETIPCISYFETELVLQDANETHCPAMKNGGMLMNIGFIGAGKVGFSLGKDVYKRQQPHGGDGLHAVIKGSAYKSKYRSCQNSKDDRPQRCHQMGTASFYYILI